MADFEWSMKCPDGATIGMIDDGNPGCILLTIDPWDHEEDAMGDRVFVTVNLDGGVLLAAAMLTRLSELAGYLDSEQV